MHAIDRKLLRDLWRLKGQVVTIALVLAAGVGGVLALVGTYRSLGLSRDAYYHETAFPDVFVSLSRAPETLARRLAEIPGVARVDTRLVEPARFPIAGLHRPASGRAISLMPGEDGDGDGSSLRGLVLRSGRAPDPTRSDEALVLETFAAAHGLGPGDELPCIIAGKSLRLRISGLVLSPEYVFAIEGGFSSERQSGVVWLERRALASLTGRHAAFDDATFRLTPDANVRAVIAAVDRELAPWGGLGAYERARQLSHRTLSSEIDQLQVLALQVPSVFLLVAAFLLNVVLNRLVHLQREQFAVLRAVGYTRWAIGRHVLAFASVIVVLGGLGGLAVGHWFGDAMTDLYAGFFHFPVLSFVLDADLVAIALTVAGGAALAGGLVAAWRAVRLMPADAMRPPAPARYRKGWLSRLGLTRLVSPSGRMIVRELERRPGAALVSILGIAFAAALVVLGRFGFDSFDYLLDSAMARSMRYDLMVNLAEPTSQSASGWFVHAPGVMATEPVRMVPVRLVNAHHHYDLAITGLAAEPRLWRVLDGRSRPVPIPREGLMLTDVLAERLEVSPGDVLTVERKDGDHARLTLPVAAIVDELTGMNAYMQFDALARALGEEPMLSAVMLSIDRAQRVPLLRAIAAMPGVIAIIDSREIREAVSAQAGESFVTMTLITMLFSMVIAVGVIYNNARVALSERGRDLATLRVLGYTRGEVAVVLLGQLALQTALALPIGLLAGRGLAEAMMASVDPEQFRWPAIVGPGTYGLAALIVIGAALATGIVVRRRLDRLDMIGALKARD